MYVDGLVHISDLGQDYFKFEQHKHMLYGERTGVRYQLAGRVRVKVVRVNLEQAKIDFVLVAGPQPQSTGPGQAKPKPRDIDKKEKKHGKYR
jgi:ribonuclease R